MSAEMSAASDTADSKNHSTFIRILSIGISGWLIVCAVAFVVLSWRWPMVGNVTYMHYVVFLMHHGMAPYRDILEMNLPGSYLIEGAVMSVLGPGSQGWRLYDLILIAVASASIIHILRPLNRAAGIFAAVLFLLVHAQDGVIMTGERDFAVSVSLLAAVSLLFFVMRGRGSVLAATVATVGFGALAGVAITIKPTVFPLIACLWVWAALESRRRALIGWGFALLAFTGLLLPLLITGIFLIKESATAAFVAALHGIIPYHASLAHRTFGFLLAHSVSPLLPLFITWLAAALVLSRMQERDPERTALLLCAACGLLSFLLQAKGFAYQRYPFLGFCCILIAADLMRLARKADPVRWLGVGGLVVGVVLSTIFLVKAARFDRNEPARPLLADLRSLGVADRSVQCMDTGGSCIDDLYAGRIVQSTGLIYDCYLLDGTNSVARGLRERFWEQMRRNPPRLLVVTESTCYEVAPNADKYARWPEFTAYLESNYALARSSGIQLQLHYWSRRQTPFAYRIYVHR